MVSTHEVFCDSMVLIPALNCTINKEINLSINSIKEYFMEELAS